MKNKDLFVFFDFGGVISGGIFGRLIKDMDMVIRSFAELGTLFIVSSSSSHSINNFLKHYNLDDLFDDVLGFDNNPNKTEKINKIIKERRADVKKCVMITDTSSDVKAAKEAGVVSVGVNWGFESAEMLKNSGAIFVAESPDQLLLFIKSLTV